jgi:signal transduction histidine kinase
VTVSLAERGESDIVLEVKNRGAPIASELLPHIFEPFRRGRVDRGTSGGLGLGLFIAAEIVRAHGGTIHVASTAADGTTFTVVLPRFNPIPNSGSCP